MRPDRLIDPSQDLDRSVGESLGTRNQRSIVDEIANASKAGKRKRLEIRDDGVIVGDADIIDFTGSGLVATVLGNVATVDGSAGGGGGAPTTAKYITQTADAGLSAEQALSSLSTGMMQSTTSTGVVQTRTLTGTANEVTVTNGDGAAGNPTFSLSTGIDAAKIGGGSVSTTEYDRLNGVTSNIQTQLDEKMTHPQVISRIWLVG